MHEVMFEYAKAYLDKHEPTGRRFPFHTRSDHIRRVLGWAKRLCGIERLPDGFNHEALYCAAAFHDIGYSDTRSGLSHAQAGAEMFVQYAKRHYFDEDFAKFVAFLIASHSSKELLTDAQTPPELVILMEADLLENTGALMVVWDCMAEGTKHGGSFESCLEHITASYDKLPDKNPMVTPEAIRIWNQKMALFADFLLHLAADVYPER